MESISKEHLHKGIFVVFFVLLLAGLVFTAIQTLEEDSLPEGVLARVGNSDITEEQFNLHLWDATNEGTPENPEGVTDELEQEVLEYLIESELLRQEAEEIGITVTAEEIEERLNSNGIGNRSLSEYNAETQILKDKVYEEVVSRRAGDYIVLRFDKYFEDDPAWEYDPEMSSDELREIRENREDINREAREYADETIEYLRENLEAGNLTFEEAMQYVEDDEDLLPDYWLNRGFELTGEFVIDGSSIGESIKESPFYESFNFNEPQITEPYLHTIEYLKNPSDEHGTNAETEEKEGMWVMLNITDVHNGDAESINEWLRQKYEEKVILADDPNNLFSSLAGLQTVQASYHQGNYALACTGGSHPIGSQNSNDFGAAVARAMYFTSNGGGPYNLSATITHTQSPSAYSYSGCPVGTHSRTSSGCQNITNPNHSQGHWCCGDDHNQHRVSASIAESGYEWTHYNVHREPRTNSAHASGTASGTSLSFTYFIANGYTSYINFIAQQDSTPVSVNLNTNPNTISEGDSATVSWTIDGDASSCNWTGNTPPGLPSSPGTSSGSRSVSPPPGSYGFGLECTGDDGSYDFSTTGLTVDADPPPQNLNPTNTFSEDTSCNAPIRHNARHTFSWDSPTHASYDGVYRYIFELNGYSQSGLSSTSAGPYTVGALGSPLGYGNTYSWRVAYEERETYDEYYQCSDWDSTTNMCVGGWSSTSYCNDSNSDCVSITTTRWHGPFNWNDGATFTTIPSAYPIPGFSWVPEEPLERETTSLWQESDTVSGVPHSFAWTVDPSVDNEDYSKSSATGEEIEMRFFEPRDFPITLTATNNDIANWSDGGVVGSNASGSCSVTQSINTIANPEFREVPPGAGH